MHIVKQVDHWVPFRVQTVILPGRVAQVVVAISTLGVGMDMR